MWYWLERVGRKTYRWNWAPALSNLHFDVVNWATFDWECIALDRASFQHLSLNTGSDIELHLNGGYSWEIRYEIMKYGGHNGMICWNANDINNRIYFNEQLDTSAIRIHLNTPTNNAQYLDFRLEYDLINDKRTIHKFWRNHVKKEFYYFIDGKELQYWQGTWNGSTNNMLKINAIWKAFNNNSYNFNGKIYNFEIEKEWELLVYVSGKHYTKTPASGKLYNAIEPLTRDWLDGTISELSDYYDIDNNNEQYVFQRYREKGDRKKYERTSDDSIQPYLNSDRIYSHLINHNEALNISVNGVTMNRWGSGHIPAYNLFFDAQWHITVPTVSGFNNRASQTLMWHIIVDRENTVSGSYWLGSYNERLNMLLRYDWTIYVESQGTGSRRYFSVDPVPFNTPVWVTVRVNTYLDPNTARLADDIDIFIGSVKCKKTYQVTWTNKQTYSSFYLMCKKPWVGNFRGLFREFRRYAGALTDEQVIDIAENQTILWTENMRQIYTNGEPTPNNSDWNRIGNVSVANDYISLPTGAYLNCGNHSSVDITNVSNGLTLYAWVWFPEGTGNRFWIISKYTSSGNNRSFSLDKYEGAWIRFILSNNGSSTGFTDTPANPNTTYFIMGRLVGNTMELWRDNVLVDTATFNHTTLHQCPDPLFVGRSWEGRSDTSIIWQTGVIHRAITDEEKDMLRALGKDGDVPPIPNTVAHYSYKHFQWPKSSPSVIDNRAIFDYTINDIESGNNNGTVSQGRINYEWITPYTDFPKYKLYSATNEGVFISRRHQSITNNVHANPLGTESNKLERSFWYGMRNFVFHVWDLVPNRDYVLAIFNGDWSWGTPNITIKMRHRDRNEFVYWNRDTHGIVTYQFTAKDEREKFEILADDESVGTPHIYSWVVFQQDSNCWYWTNSF